MQEIKLELIQDPFPHAIIRNFYNEEDLSLIWKELDFLTSPHKMVPSTVAGSAVVHNQELANNYAIDLDATYQDRNISNILRINRKIFNKQILDPIATSHPLLGHLNKHVHLDWTKIKYYENNQEYKSHTDGSRFTFCTYFYRKPKSFSGGDLWFEDFNYTIPIENNMVVFFVGCIKHASTSLIMDEFLSPFNGKGKYVMTQFLDFKFA